MDLTKEAEYILNFLPSEVYKQPDLKVRLMEIMAKLGHPFKRGCPDCYNRAYYRLMQLYKNKDMKVEEQSTYLFRKNLHGYRSKATGKVLRNETSTPLERKEVYDTSTSHRALFDLASIPSTPAPQKKAAQPKKKTVSSSPKKSSTTK